MRHGLSLGEVRIKGRLGQKEQKPDLFNPLIEHKEHGMFLPSGQLCGPAPTPRSPEAPS